MDDHKRKQNSERCYVAIAVRQHAGELFLQRMSTKHANVYHGVSARLKRNPTQLTALVPKSSTQSTAWRKVGSSVLYRRVLRSMSRQIHGEQAHKLSACVSSSGSSETLLGLDVALPLLNELHSWLNRLVKLQTLCNSQIALQTMLLHILTKTICSSYAMSHTT